MAFIMKANCKVISGAFHTNSRDASTSQIIFKESDGIQIVYNQNDTLESFEMVLNELCGNSSFYKIKKKISTYILSIVSVVVILFALISSSLYEDLMKKILLESPFDWSGNDTIAFLFVLLFFFGLVLMPSILDGEGSQFKEALKSWFNKDTRLLKRLRLSMSVFDKKSVVRIYNIDVLTQEHWAWRLMMPCLLNHFMNVELYVRSDQKKRMEKRLKQLGCLTVDIKSILDSTPHFKDNQVLFSTKEEVLFSLMQLSSTALLQKKNENIFVSLELFEYCGRNFYDNKNNDKTELISGFQNFVNRCFDDFKLLEQHKANQIYFTNNVTFKDLEEERRRLSYYLRNHIEECLQYFDNPISLLILYYYVKEIVLDEKRTIAILEKFIHSVEKKQQYTLINTYWFDIAGEMFDASDIENFEHTNQSIYRKLSIETLNKLKFLFERNGHFAQALLITQYLYEINPSCYAVDMCSLFERMGQFDNAYNSLPSSIELKSEQHEKPTDTQVRYFQRKSWIIVSQRKEEKKEEGLALLHTLEDILFRHTQNNEPIWLWHLYNIKANYAEWNKNYKEAITYYKKCLCIPALGAFEYGATFINMSIAYRFMFLKNTSQDLEIINKSITVGSIGVALKNSVGDRDEMPVVLHNQALNILCKVLQEEDKTLIQQVKTLTNEGIEILDHTASVKRLGIMLCENLISKCLLNEDVTLIQKRLEGHWSSMDAYEQEQIKMIYEKFMNKGKCKALEI